MCKYISFYSLMNRGGGWCSTTGWIQTQKPEYNPKTQKPEYKPKKKNKKDFFDVKLRRNLVVKIT